MVKAYRVERAPGGYQLKITGKNITDWNWSGSGMGISISFGDSAHSEYYSQEHSSEKWMRVVEFEMSDGFWNGLKYLKKFGKEKDQEAGKNWLEQNGWKKSLAVPSGSDGAHLDSLTKKTALTFSEDWKTVLAKGFVKESVSIAYPENESFPAVDDEGSDMGFFTIADIKEYGFDIAPPTNAQWEEG